MLSSQIMNSIFSSLKSLRNSLHRRTSLTHLNLLNAILMNLSLLALLPPPPQLRAQTEMNSFMNQQIQEALELLTSEVTDLLAQLHLAETLIPQSLHLAPMAPHSEA